MHFLQFADFVTGAVVASVTVIGAWLADRSRQKAEIVELKLAVARLETKIDMIINNQKSNNE